jgi:dipeptidyl aminopeptidase/acylaminoacyl peptidase
MSPRPRRDPARRGAPAASDPVGRRSPAPVDPARGSSPVTASLVDALRTAPLPAADAARTRAWAVLSDAHASRVPAARTRRRARVIALAFAALLLLAAVAVAADSPRWVRSVLGTAAPPHPVKVSLGSLPAGRLLVSSARGTWIVRGDGTRLRLGPWTAATWSPRGLYIAAWRGRELSAVAPDGRVAWTLAAPATVRDARWSPDGYRIAYRRAGGLALVAGDGTGPRVVAAAVRPVAPAWRPGEPHTLAWVGARGTVEVRDVDTGGVVWRSAASVGAVRELLWSSDGRRLLARGEHRLVVLDVHANRVRRIALPRATTVTSAAWAPRGRRLALALRAGTTSSIAVTTSTHLASDPTFAVAGTLTSLAWSPDASRLLVRWRESDQWLLLPTTHRTQIPAIPAISHRFGGVPAVQGWCCG